MSNEIKRMRYFNGLLLKDDDLTLEQDYHIKMHRLHNYYLHDYGIAYGLEVVAVDNAPRVRVEKGLALNRVTIETIDKETKEKQYEAQSQEIWIGDNHPDNPIKLDDYAVDVDIYITVCYEEEEVDVDITKGGDEKLHVWERARIKHSLKLPEDPAKDIILARVNLAIDKYGQKCVKEISYFHKDKIRELRTNASPDKGCKRFEKILIGRKESENSPYIVPLIDDNMEKGIEMHSSITKFSGTIENRGLNTEGDVDIKGVFTVKANSQEALKVDSKGNTEVANSLLVKDKISAQNGIYIGGENINIDTSKVLVTSNTLTINNYDDKKDINISRDVDSGLDIYRGGQEPNAKLIWSEKEKIWKAGIEGTEMYQIAYGEHWDKLHKGKNADILHKHKQLFGDDENIKLSVDARGNIDIPQSIVVSGKVLANGGIEVSRPGELPTAKLAWNEKTKHWQVEDKEEMINLVYGREWDELISGNNVDNLHNHSCLHTGDGKASIVRVNPNGNVDIANDLTVGQNLTVVGDFTVKGKNSVITTEKLEVADNFIVVNTHQISGEPISQSGIEVCRGDKLDNARIIWDEGSKKWKIGVGNEVSIVPYGHQWDQLINGGITENLHNHNKLYSRGGSEVLTVLSDNDLEADSNLAIRGGLEVEKNVVIKGDLKLSKSIIVEGDFTVKGTTTAVNKRNLEVDDNKIIVNRYPDNSKPFEEAGFEVYRGGVVPNARIVWDEKGSKWKFGVGNDIVELPNAEGWQALTSQGIADKLHKHSILCDSNNNSSISVKDNDINIKGNTNVKGNFSIDGSLEVLGDIDVKGTVTSVNKIDMKVTDNFITLNNFEGDISKLNESGIEVFRGNKSDKARIIWDESVKKWRIGVGTDLKEILCGEQWNKVISGNNADGIHLHGQLYNSKGDILGLSVSARGDVDIAHGLSVAHDLTVLGNLEVKGSLASFNTDMFEIRGNSIIVNRYESTSVSTKAESGLKVFRGANNSFAGIIWDETISSWKIGLLDGKEGLVVDKEGSVTALGKVKAKSLEFSDTLQGNNGEFAGNVKVQNINVNGKLTVKNGIEVVRMQEYGAHVKWEENFKRWNIGTTDKTGIVVTEEGKVGIGQVAPKSTLDVIGNAAISGEFIVGKNSLITEDLNVKGSINVEKKLNVVNEINCKNIKVSENININNNVISRNGLEIIRVDERGKSLPSAKINWCEEEKAWYFGQTDQMEKIMLSKHTHDKLYSPQGDVISVSANKFGHVGIGINEPEAKLHVKGDSKFEGNMVADGQLVVKNGVFNSNITSNGKLIGNVGIFSGNVGIGVEKPLAKLHVGESAQFDGNITSNGDIISKNGTIIGNTGLFNKSLQVNENVISGNGIEINRVDDQSKKLPSAKITWSKEENAWLCGIDGSLDKLVNSKHTHSTLCDSGKEGKVSVTVNDKGDVGIGVEKPLAKLHVGESAQFDGSITLSGDVTSSNGSIVGKNGVFKGDLSVNGDIVAGNGIEVIRVDEKGNKLPPAKIAWSKAENAWVYGVGNEVDKITGSKHKHNTLYDNSKEEKVSVTVNDKGNVGIGIEKPLAKLHVSESAQFDGNITLSGDVTSSNGSIVGKNGVFKGDLSVNGDIVAGNGIEVIRVDEKDNKLPSAKITWSKVENAWVYGVGNEVDKITGSKHKHNTLYDSSKEEKVSVTVNDKGNVGIGVDKPLAKLHVSESAQFDGNITLNGDVTSSNGSIAGKNGVFKGDLSVNGTIMAGSGIEVVRVDEKDNKLPSAKITWSKAENAWVYGVGNEVDKITGSKHKHNTLCDSSKEERVSIIVNDQGKVGIGTDTPSAKLQVNGDAVFNDKITGMSEMEIGSSALIVTKDGNVGIGKKPDAGIKLDIDGVIRVNGLAQRSSKDNNENIEELKIDRAIELLKGLKPVSYNCKTDTSKKQNIGFIAEEVPEVFSVSDKKSVSFMDIIGVLTAIVKSQNEQLANMDDRITKLEQKIK